MRNEERRLRSVLIYVSAAHMGQTYFGSEGEEPYLMHLLRVMAAVPKRSRLVGLCHDLLEDTDWAVPWELTEPERRAVRLLTHEKDVSYTEYISAIMHAPGLVGDMAREVKLADINTNLLDGGRDMPGKRREYAAVREALRMAVPGVAQEATG